MGKEIDSYIAKLDLDSSGFLKGAEKVLKTIDRLNEALAFKGAEAGITRLGAAINGTLGSAFSGASAAAVRFSAVLSSECMSASQQAATCAVSVAEAFAGAAAQTETVFAGLGARLTQEFDAAETAASSFSGGVVASVRNAFGSAETAAGAACTGIGAKIAGVAKTAAVAGVTAAAIGAAVIAAAVAVRAKVAGTVDGIRAKVSEGVGGIRETVANGLDTVKAKVRDALAHSRGLTDKFINDLKVTMQTAFPQTYAIVSVWAANVHAKFEELKNRIAPVFEAIFNGISVTFERIRSVTVGVLEGIRTQFSSVADGITGVFSKVTETVRGFADKISAHFKKNKGEAAELAQQAAQLSADLNDAASAAQNLGQALDGALSEASDDGEKTADAIKDIGEAFRTTAAAGENTSGAMAGFGEEVKKLSEDIIKAMAGLDRSEEELEDFGEEAEEAGKQAEDFGDKTEEAGEKAEKSGKKAGGAFEGLRKLLYSLGHDLGELPFKLDEIGEKGGTVGKALSAGLGFGIDKLKDLGGKIIPLTLAALGDKLRGVHKDLEDVNGEADISGKAVKAVGDAASNAVGKFTHLGAVAFGALERIGQKAADAGTKLLRSLSVDNIAQGWQEYGLKINSTQTIMASTGESLATVNGYLEELNEYADRTIYSFSDMTANIGKFTNAGVDLETAVAAMKGISNEAALSGANAQEASRAMYNFAQALSSGSVKLIDWKSIENANMATKQFKEQLIETAVDLGTLTKSGEEYISTTTDANGHVAEAFTATKKFNESLSAQWMTTEVLTRTLAKYADETTDFGQKAYAAAQDIKTGAQLMDTLKEAVGSGWSRTFELIIGDLNDAKQFWTGINNLISPVMEAISGARNGLLEGWRALGGRETFLTSLKGAFANLIDILKAAKDGFETFLPPMTAERLKEITDKAAAFVDKIKLNDEQLSKVKDIFSKVSKGIRDTIDSFGRLYDKLKGFLGGNGTLGRLKESFSEMFGVKYVFGKNGLLSVIDSLAEKVSAFAQNRIIGTIRDHLDSIATVAQNVIQLISTVFEHLGGIFSAAGELLGGIADTVSNNLDDILSFIDGVVTAAKGVIDVFAAFVKSKLDTFRTFLPVLLDIVLGIVNGIGDALRGIGIFISDHASAIAHFAGAFLVMKKVVPILGGVLSAVAKISSVIKLFSALKSLKVPISIIAAINKTFGATITEGTLLTGVLKGIGTAVMGTVGPWLAAAAAIVAVVAAVGSIIYFSNKHVEALEEEIRQTYGMSEEQRAFNKELANGAEAYRDMAEARKKSYENVNGEYDYYHRLAEELQGLVDENGKIKEGYEARVSFITGELSKALDIEIGIVDGVVQKYGELNGQITDLIENKRKYALLDAAQEGYVEATKNVKQDRMNWGKAKAGQEEANDLLVYASAVKQELDALFKDRGNIGTDFYSLDSYSKLVQDFIKANDLLAGNGNVKVGDLITKYEALYQTASDSAKDAAKALSDASEKYFGDLKDISNYENLKMTLDSGDSNASNLYALKLQYDFIPAEGATQEALDAQAQYFQKYYEDLKTMAAKGTEGVTQEMVDEAELMWAMAKAEAQKGAAELSEAQNRALSSPKDGGVKEIIAEKQMMRAAKGASSAKVKNANKNAATEVSDAANEGLSAADTQETGMKQSEKSAKGFLLAKDENGDAGEETAEEANRRFGLVDFFNKAYAKAMDWAKGLSLGTKSAKAAALVSSAASTLAKMIESVTAGTLKTGSPSKVAARLGGYWGQGLVVGMESMEKAVGEESRTLSETLVDGGALSPVRDIFGGEFDDAVTVTPVLDLSEARNGTARLREMIDGAAGMRMGGMDISGLLNATVTPDEDGRMLREVQGLRRDMAAFNEKLTRLQVRMDTGELVGALRDPMDEALGGLTRR